MQASGWAPRRSQGLGCGALGRLAGRTRDRFGSLGSESLWNEASGPDLQGARQTLARKMAPHLAVCAGLAPRDRQMAIGVRRCYLTRGMLDKHCHSLFKHHCKP